RTRLRRPRRPPPAGGAQRRAVDLPPGRRRTGVPPPPERGRAVRIGGRGRRPRRLRRAPHRHGRGRRRRTAGAAPRRRADHRTGRGHQRGLGHARGRGGAGRGGRGGATAPGRRAPARPRARGRRRRGRAAARWLKQARSQPLPRQTVQPPIPTGPTMDSRVLLRLAAPLALTLVLVVAQALDLAPAVRWGALAARTLAGLWFAWTTGRPADTALLRDQGRLLEELRNFIGAEVEGSRAEIDRTRELIRESVAKLGTSFDAVNRRSRQQSEVAARILDRRNGGDDSGSGSDVHRFAVQASQQMEQLVEALEAVSGQSGATVTHIDAMAEHLDGIFSLLEDVKSIA